jgi:hypothetical protein
VWKKSDFQLSNWTSVSCPDVCMLISSVWRLGCDMKIFSYCLLNITNFFSQARSYEVLFILSDCVEERWCQWSLKLFCFGEPLQFQVDYLVIYVTLKGQPV